MQEISFWGIIGALKVGNLNVNGFSRTGMVPGEAKVSADDGIKKSSGKSSGSGIKWFGSSLKRGLRNAISCFNPATLSSRAHDFDSATVRQSTAFASGEIKKQEQKLQERLRDSRATQGRGGYAGSGAGRPQVNAHADRQSRAANATPPQSRPQARVQHERPQTPNAMHARLHSLYAHQEKMSEAEARRIVDLGVPTDSDDVEGDLDKLQTARQVLEEVQAKKDRARLQKKISEALHPGGMNTRVSSGHALLRKEQENNERILAERPHYHMSSDQLKELTSRHNRAAERLKEIESAAVYENAQDARNKKMTQLQGKMDEVENALRKLNKSDPGHPDFDDRYLRMHDDPQLPKQRARLENRLAQLTLDLKISKYEGQLAQWAYELESKKGGVKQAQIETMFAHAENVSKEIRNAYKTSEELGYTTSDRAVINARLQQLDRLQKKISEALHPGGMNTRVASQHALLRKEQENNERILAERPDYRMSSDQLKELTSRHNRAAARLKEIEPAAVYQNAQKERIEKMTHLQGKMTEVKNALRTLSKSDRGHPDLDGRYDAPQLRRQRAQLEKKLAQLTLDLKISKYEGQVARWAYELESGKGGIEQARIETMFAHAENVSKEIRNAYKTSEEVGYTTSDRAVVNARLQQLDKQVKALERELWVMDGE